MRCHLREKGWVSHRSGLYLDSKPRWQRTTNDVLLLLYKKKVMRSEDYILKVASISAKISAFKSQNPDIRVDTLESLVEKTIISESDYHFIQDNGLIYQSDNDSEMFSFEDNNHYEVHGVYADSRSGETLNLSTLAEKLGIALNDCDSGRCIASLTYYNRYGIVISDTTLILVRVNSDPGMLRRIEDYLSKRHIVRIPYDETSNPPVYVSFDRLNSTGNFSEIIIELLRDYFGVKEGEEITFLIEKR